jgi:hypothetical protein
MAAHPYSQKRFVKDPSLVAQQVIDETVLVPVQPAKPGQTQPCYVMNATAGAAWELIDGQRRVVDIVDQLAGEYQIAPAQIESDLIALFQHLETIGAVRAV